MPRADETGRAPARKFTPQTRKKLLELLRKGHKVKPACAMVGVHHGTFYDWLKRAAQARDRRSRGEKLNAVERAYIKFADDVGEHAELVEAYGEAFAYENFITEATKPRSGQNAGNWLPWMQLLERRYGWGRHRVEHTGPDGGPIPMRIDLDSLTAEQRQQLREILEQGKAAK